VLPQLTANNQQTQIHLCVAAPVSEAKVGVGSWGLAGPRRQAARGVSFWVHVSGRSLLEA